MLMQSCCANCEVCIVFTSACLLIRVSVCVCQHVRTKKNWKTTIITNWYNLVATCNMISSRRNYSLVTSDPDS